MRLLTFPACACGRGSWGEPNRGGIGAARIAASQSLTTPQRDTRKLTAWPAEGEWLCREAALCQTLPRGHPWALAGSWETRMERAPQLPLPPPRGSLSCPRGQDPYLDDACPVLVLALSTCMGFVFRVCPCSPVPC